MGRKWRNQSQIILLSLFFICVLLFAFSFLGTNQLSADEVLSDSGIAIGDTVTPGHSILKDNKTLLVPILGNIGFLKHQILSLDIEGIIKSLSTGVIDYDYSYIFSSGVNGYGISTINLPGFIQSDGNGQLCVKDVTDCVWGKNVKSDYLVKTSSGVDFYVGNKLKESIPTDKIRSYDFSSYGKNSSDVASFYNDASNKEGAIYNLAYGVGSISDGRNDITAEQFHYLFGDEAFNNANSYPLGNSVIIYLPNHTEVKGASASTSLGDHSEYGNDLRESNAKTFCDAWNNTIIPPHGTSSGKVGYTFGVAKDSSSPGGAAAHGVCPSARVLRNAVMDEGFSLPSGMLSDENAVQYGVHPSEGIFVKNPLDVPVKLILWTDGSGTGMQIHCQVVKLQPT